MLVIAQQNGMLKRTPEWVVILGFYLWCVLVVIAAFTYEPVRAAYWRIRATDAGLPIIAGAVLGSAWFIGQAYHHVRRKKAEPNGPT